MKPRRLLTPLRPTDELVDELVDELLHAQWIAEHTYIKSVGVIGQRSLGRPPSSTVVSPERIEMARKHLAEQTGSHVTRHDVAEYLSREAGKHIGGQTIGRVYRSKFAQWPQRNS